MVTQTSSKSGMGTKIMRLTEVLLVGASFLAYYLSLNNPSATYTSLLFLCGSLAYLMVSELTICVSHLRANDNRRYQYGRSTR